MTAGFELFQRILLVVCLIAGTVAFAWVLKPFAMPIFWALIAAVVLYPAYVRVCGYVRGWQSTGAALTIVLALILVLAPLSAVATLIAQQALDTYQSFSQYELSYDRVLDRLPIAEATLERFGIDHADITSRIASVGRSAAEWLAGEALTIGKGTASVILKTVLMLYLLFFFLRDGRTIARYIMRALPLGDDREQELFTRFASTVRAIIKGTVVVAIVQGTLGTLLFFAVGVPNAALWGAVMGLGSLIPAVGPGIVWVPAGVLLLLLGDVSAGIAVLVGGVFISAVDNVLRPLLVGKDTAMPDALILLSILGGIASFGLAGVIFGPVISALFLTMWQMFMREYDTTLKERG